MDSSDYHSYLIFNIVYHATRRRPQLMPESRLCINYVDKLLLCFPCIIFTVRTLQWPFVNHQKSNKSFCNISKDSKQLLRITFSMDSLRPSVFLPENVFLVSLLPGARFLIKYLLSPPSNFFYPIYLLYPFSPLIDKQKGNFFR